MIKGILRKKIGSFYQVKAKQLLLSFMALGAKTQVFFSHGFDTQILYFVAAIIA
jgi:hypothetical protein